MAHRDTIIHPRLATQQQQQLTFVNGNHTLQISSLGFLYYANVSLGTPGLTFLVALDTGSGLFWVPCDCVSCVKSLPTTSGAQGGCPESSSTCSYDVQYLSSGTSSSGVLVEDILHLTTEGNNSKVIDAQITFGCGLVETGLFLEDGAPNGLFGLGMYDSSVPSILFKAGIAENSFSMCFGPDGTGRISFGDHGSLNQDETPFNIDKLNPSYNISVTQITVESNQSNIDFSAIFDSGTSFTYLNDPAYTTLSETFNSYVEDKRSPSDPSVPFEYCYGISSNETSILVPNVSLTMKGGNLFTIFDPIVVISDESGSIYCLAVVKSSDVNIIGENFMTGYNVIFDREKLLLGWKPSNCYDLQYLPVLPPATSAEPPINTAVPPSPDSEPYADTPKANSGTGKGPQILQPSVGLSTCILFILFHPFLAMF